MSGIYIHVPYCKHKCEYCDFYSIAGTDSMQQFHTLIKKEIELRGNYLPSKEIETIYFGGGTPSLLQLSQVHSILETINNSFNVNDTQEITLEANPDDLSFEYLSELKSLGVNRLSIGVQSFSDNDLVNLGRRHNAKQAISSVEQAGKAGFSNISIDLIYGLPYSSTEIWKNNLEKAFSLPIQHLSCYHLIYEEGTPLFKNVKANEVTPIDDDISVEQFKLLQQWAKERNFTHYEISNLAKEDFYSKHNLSYWTQKPYLGLGPSAHSFNIHTREWNPRSIAQWKDSLHKDWLNTNSETLSDKDKINEYLLTTLRTIWGADLYCVEKNFGSRVKYNLLKKAEKYIASGRLESNSLNLRIPTKYYIVSDGIISDLFEV